MFTREHNQDFPGSPVVKTEFPVQGARVPSLVRDLRSHHVAQQKKRERERIQPFYFSWKNKMRCSLVKSLSFSGFISLVYSRPSSRSLGVLTNSTLQMRKNLLHQWPPEVREGSRSHHPTLKHNFWAPGVVSAIKEVSSSTLLNSFSFLLHIFSKCPMQARSCAEPQDCQMNKPWFKVLPGERDMLIGTD